MLTLVAYGNRDQIPGLLHVRLTHSVYAAMGAHFLHIIYFLQR